MADSGFEAINSQPAPSEALSALQSERIGEMFGAGAVQKTSGRPGDKHLMGPLASPDEGNSFAQLHSQMNEQLGELTKLLGSGVPTQSEKTMLQAGKTMAAGTDSKTALAQAEPQFKQAIEQADEALGAVGAKVSKMPEADRQRAAAQAEESQALSGGLQKELLSLSLPDKLKAKLNEDQQREELAKLRDKVDAEIETFMKTQPGEDYAYRGLQADLQQYPKIYQLAAQKKALDDSDPYKTVKGLESQYGRAIADSVLSRITYGEALGSAGRENDAYKQMREGFGILGIKLPKNLPGTLDA